MKFNLWGLDDHPELVEALFAAHRQAAIANDNASKLCVQQAWGGSGRFENAIIAGMATIGALHAPLVAARELWEIHKQLGDDAAEREIRAILDRGERVPGFGNSFHCDIDPAFSRLDRLIYHDYGDAASWGITHLSGIVEIELSERRGIPRNDIRCGPNAALYTAAVASICEVPRGLEPALFAMARIPAWAELCGATRHPKVGA